MFPALFPSILKTTFPAPLSLSLEDDPSSAHLSSPEARRCTGSKPVRLTPRTVHHRRTLQYGVVCTVESSVQYSAVQYSAQCNIARSALCNFGYTDLSLQLVIS